ncbi:BTB/POZ domain-containing protein [Melia azedarach]|uniref:BTB/POZ domain-containing protein n=1 Tax=Melia azedarach TaxID=155640 RepID=A0ACC1YUB4_MELAZ|nr:BTB/POZ domain-containing protein [Melia azedarach]
MRPSKDSKQGGRGDSITGHVSTLRQRLFHALSLGISYYDGKELKWKCTDIEIQRHVIRSIAAFLDSISRGMVQHSFVKESIPHIVGALVWILKCKSGACFEHGSK